MHRVFKLYEISYRSGFLAIEDEKGVPGNLWLRAIGLVELQKAISSTVRPDTFEFKLSNQDVLIEDESDWLHGIPPFLQILSD